MVQILKKYDKFHIFIIAGLMTLIFFSQSIFPIPFLLAFIITQISFLLYMILVFKSGRTLMSEFNLYFKKNDIIRGIKFGILAMLSYLFLFFVFTPNIDNSYNYFQNDSFISRLLLFFLMCISGPIIEELLFRGYFWKIVENINNNKIFIIICTSLLFALFHFDPNRFITILISSIIFGYARQKSGRLSISVIAHMTNNLIVFIFASTF